MTNYNDGAWHIWHGGECPVHPKSVVDAVWHDPNQETTGIRNGTALGGAWRGQIVKFRVVKAYREPVDGWITTPEQMREAAIAKLEYLQEVSGRNQDGDFYVGEEAACFAASVIDDAVNAIRAIPIAPHPADPLSDPRVVALVEAAKPFGFMDGEYDDLPSNHRVVLQVVSNGEVIQEASIEQLRAMSTALRAIGGEA